MAATWNIITPTIGSWQLITDTSTTKNHPLGLRVKAEHATFGVAEFIYGVGVASTIATDWVVFIEGFATARLTADLHGAVGIAMSANVASSYGWYCIYGHCNGGSGGAIVDSAVIFATGAGAVGTVDDTVVDGDMVHNALPRSTIGGAVITGEFQLWYPYVDNITTND